MLDYEQFIQIRKEHEIKPLALLVLMDLMSVKDALGVVKVNITSISERTGISRNSVSSFIDILECSNLISLKSEREMLISDQLLKFEQVLKNEQLGVLNFEQSFTTEGETEDANCSDLSTFPELDKSEKILYNETKEHQRDLEKTPINLDTPKDTLQDTDIIQTPLRTFTDTSADLTPTIPLWDHLGPDGLPVTLEEWNKVLEVYNSWKEDDKKYLTGVIQTEPLDIYYYFRDFNLTPRWSSTRDVKNCIKGIVRNESSYTTPSRPHFSWEGNELGLFKKWELTDKKLSWDEWRDKVLMEDYEGPTFDGDLSQYIYSSTLEYRRRLLSGH